MNPIEFRISLLERIIHPQMVLIQCEYCNNTAIVDDEIKMDEESVYVVDSDKAVIGTFGCISPCYRISLSQQIIASETKNFDFIYSESPKGILLQSATLIPFEFSSKKEDEILSIYMDIIFDKNMIGNYVHYAHLFVRDRFESGVSPQHVNNSRIVAHSFNENLIKNIFGSAVMLGSLSMMKRLN